METTAPAAAVSEDWTPVPWWARICRWKQTSTDEAKHAEHALLTEMSCPVKARDIPCGPNPTDFLHTLVGGREDAPPVVVMPGYFAGSAFYFRNFTDLSEHFRLYCLDWLGTGLSGRPEWKAKSREEAEAFFLDSLVRWKEQMGLDKFILVGHSLGGYLATCYALQHPEHLHSLVLVGPAGVPTQPENWEEEIIRDGGFVRKTMLKMVRNLWNGGTTPGDGIRFAGPFGPALVEWYVTRRFKHHGDGLSENETRLFKDYFYHIAASPGSGEFALPHLLAPGAWAHCPIGERFKDLKVPLTIIYGEHDWMRPASGVQACKAAMEARSPLSSSDLQVLMIPNAGHYVFLDQPKLFMDRLLEAVEPVMRKLKNRSGSDTPVTSA